MTDKQTILIVDDTPQNIELLSEVLGNDYRIKAATSGERALKIIEAESPPDLVLLDIMMPGLSGYDVCERLKANPAARAIPVIFVTAMGEVQDETKGLALGGVDYITKPIVASIVQARVKTHLTVYNQRREIEAQARKLQEWNVTLGQRVADGVAQVERLSMLKRFFSPTITSLILDGTAEDPLKSHRREIVVVFLDLRGFTAFTETADPEDVMGVLHEYHTAMGDLILANGGTIERFFGDGIMVVFNDPLPVPNPAGVAVRMAIDMQRQFAALLESWRKRGYELLLGIGIAQGYATIGTIGCEGRREYSATGTVCNLAARLCGEAKGGQILLSQRAQATLGDDVKTGGLGDLTLKGFHRPVKVYEVSVQG